MGRGECPQAPDLTTDQALLAAAARQPAAARPPAAAGVPLRTKSTTLASPLPTSAYMCSKPSSGVAESVRWLRRSVSLTGSATAAPQGDVVLESLGHGAGTVTVTVTAYRAVLANVSLDGLVEHGRQPRRVVQWGHCSLAIDTAKLSGVLHAGLRSLP